MEESNKKEDLIINDKNSDIEKEMGGDTFKKEKILVISVAIIFFISLIISLILLNKNIESEEEKEILGEMICEYEISNVLSKTQILSIEFKKEFKISAIIDEQKFDDIPYSYKFLQKGNNKIKFLFYQNVKMDNMFKDISALKVVEMISEKNLKILSMKNAFDNCQNLKKFNITGFDIAEIKSVHKVFYKTNSLEDLNFEIFEKNNIEDMSFFLANSKVCSIIFYQK